jgi:hypothetical protein
MKSMQAIKPQTKEITKQESQVLVRNLIRTSISTICYLRNLFPDESFQQRSLVGIDNKFITFQELIFIPCFQSRKNLKPSLTGWKREFSTL